MVTGKCVILLEYWAAFSEDRHLGGGGCLTRKIEKVAAGKAGEPPPPTYCIGDERVYIIFPEYISIIALMQIRSQEVKFIEGI